MTHRTATKRSRFRFIGEIIAELRKVVWLSRREAAYLTFLVLVVTVAVGIVLGVIPLVLSGSICPLAALGAGKMDNNSGFRLPRHVYSMMRLKVPAPTVLPPSRIAKRKPFSRATG